MIPADLVGPVAVHIDGSIVYANSAFRSLIAADLDADLAGSSLTDFVTSNYRDQLRAQFTQVAEKSVPALGLDVELAVNGDTRDAIAVTSPIDWRGESCLQTSFITTGGERFRDWPVKEQAMHEAPVGITIADATHEGEPLIYVNDGFVELTGYPRAEILGQNCRFLQGEDTREEPVAQLRGAIDEGEPVTVELRNYRKDGQMFWNRVSITPIIEETGEVTHFLGFQEDVSAAKLSEQEKTLFEKQTESARHAMFVTDRDGVIRYVNPAFERITGYSAHEAIGETPSILKSGHHDEEFYTELWDTLTAGEIWEAKITNKTKSGELYQVDQTIVPVTDDRGEITHFAAIERDITDEQLTEQVLDVMNRVLRHNLRSSIGVIDGYASILEQGVETADQRAAARTIRERAQALQEISEKSTSIRQFLQGREDPHPIAVTRITDLVAEYQETYREADIDVTVDVPGELMIDNGIILETALDEAIENAIVHTDQNPPEVAVTVTQAETGDIHIEIADNGPGIPTKEWEIIKTGHETPMSHSLGIGLWLIYWAVTALGGEITLTENDPQGSVLQLQIPVSTTT